MTRRLALRAARALRDYDAVMVAHGISNVLRAMPYFESRKSGRAMLPRKRSSRVILVGDGVGNGHDPIAFHHFREKAALAAQSLEAGAARRKSEIEWLRGLIEWMGDKCSDLKTLRHDLRYNSESSINVLLQQLIDDPESVEAAAVLLLLASGEAVFAPERVLVVLERAAAVAEVVVVAGLKLKGELPTGGAETAAVAALLHLSSSGP